MYYKRKSIWKNKVKPSINGALVRKDLEQIKSLVQSGKDINALIPCGFYGYKTLLEHCVEFGDLNTLKFLISLGYDLYKNNHENDSQFTLFVRAIQNLGNSLSIQRDENDNADHIKLVEMAMYLIPKFNIDLVNRDIEEIKNSPYQHFITEPLRVFNEAFYKLEIKKNQLVMQQALRTKTSYFNILPDTLLDYILAF